MKLISLSALLMFSFFARAQDFSVDQKLGAEGKAQVEATMGIYSDSEKNRIITQLGNKLVKNLKNPNFEYHFFLVDAGEPNAFALPGGYIFFTRGILALANSEDELAGVMGHEIIHSANRHTIKQQKKSFLPGLLKVPGALTGALMGENAAKIFTPLDKGGEALMASHSRKDEFEADELGVELAAKSGYDPLALSRMLSTLGASIEIFTGEKEKPSYFSDHPYTPRRIEGIQKKAEQLQPAASEPVFKSKHDFLKFIDGVEVGPNPRQGIFQGDWFLHPDLNFKIKIPASWIRQNSPTAVVAADSTQSAIVMLEVESQVKSAASAAESFATAFKKNTGVSVNVTEQKVNGNPSSRIAVTKNQGNDKVTVTVFWIEWGGNVYKLTGASSPETITQVVNVLESFTRLPENERKGITKRIVRVVETGSGETLKMVSDRSHNVIPLRLIAAANGIPESKVFEQGDLVKVVVEVPYQ